MATVSDMLREGAGRLSGEGAKREAALLLQHVLGVSEAWLVAHADDGIDQAQVAPFDALVTRRASGEPIAYLIGRRGFHALDLEVTPDVLIPRAETELLVELALARIPQGTRCTVADLGTGSGAVALAIAKARPEALVLATDASDAALIVARRNAERLRLHNVEFASGDWCNALQDTRFDVIVSNPPYIAEDDPHLNEGDLRFEPRAALASGADGLDAIRAIVRDAPAHLREGGWLLFEHGFEQGAAARALLQEHHYRDVSTHSDLEGRERVSGGRRGVGKQPEMAPACGFPSTACPRSQSAAEALRGRACRSGGSRDRVGPSGPPTAYSPIRGQNDALAARRLAADTSLDIQNYRRSIQLNYRCRDRGLR